MTFYRLNCNNLGHTWIWTEQQLHWFSTFFQITSITPLCYWSGISYASWFTANKYFQYDLLARPKCRAALNHGCYCPHLTPVSRVLQNLPLVCDRTRSERLAALWHSPRLVLGGSYAKVNMSVTCWAGRKDPSQIWNQVCTHTHELGSFSKRFAILKNGSNSQQILISELNWLLLRLKTKICSLFWVRWKSQGIRYSSILKGSCDSCLHCILPAKSCRKPYTERLGAFCLISIFNRDREQLRS